MDTIKSSTADKTGGAEKLEQTSTYSKDTSVHRCTSIKMVESICLIWLDKNINENNEDHYNKVIQLRRVVNSVTTFTDTDQCVDFLTDMHNENVCMLISGALCQIIVPLIHDATQLHTIFIFCANQTRYEQWAKNWHKIKGIFTDSSQICDVLKRSSQQCEQNAISISFVSTSGDTFKKNLDQLDPAFMYTQIMKEILLSIKFEQQHIKEFIDYCRAVFDGSQYQLKNVDKLERKYHDETPVWWYTSDCFLYSMLNRALRMMDVDIIIKMGFFIGDLHRHIEILHNQQFDSHPTNKIFTVYRGQGLSKADFDQLKNTKGGLMSFNNFLSVSKDRDVSLAFADSNLGNPDLIGILFVMVIDPSKSTTPFASVNGVGYFQLEDEVLFSMHTVFRIGSIQSIDENHRLFQVDLTLTSDNDKDLRTLTDLIREETFQNEEGWYRLGLILCRMRQSRKAQQIYEVLLEQATNESEKAPIYGQIGATMKDQGKYEDSITFSERALEIFKKTLPPNHPNLVPAYNNIGLVYSNMGEYSKALSHYEKALEIRQQLLSPNHPDLAEFYNNIGVVYHFMSEYSKALSYYEKTLKIQQQSLPPNHPSLAATYNNTGNLCINMNEYSKALSYYEKAFEIQRQSLPSNHPDLAMSYNNIGIVHHNMGEYLKALSYYEKALELRQQLGPSNHPDLAKSYNNIGTVYCNMGEYSNALSYYEKGFEIRQQSLSANHPDLAASYNSIGFLYSTMNEYSKALSHYEKALEIQQQSLPPNHPDLAESCNNIGMIYMHMSDYSKARSFLERAVNIGQQSLPSNHPNQKTYRNNLEDVKK
jgi:tetratricopeptide (TPR) repeat protein